mmetsp:Transcript_41899/g.102737  ORF Transcript_41899/g.102737 Transcript_41899/m.102737 type:complete len:298 (-) Transcript_41899:507-1400(-)
MHYMLQRRSSSLSNRPPRRQAKQKRHSLAEQEILQAQHKRRRVTPPHPPHLRHAPSTLNTAYTRYTILHMPTRPSVCPRPRPTPLRIPHAPCTHSRVHTQARSRPLLAAPTAALPLSHRSDAVANLHRVAPAHLRGRDDVQGESREEALEVERVDARVEHREPKELPRALLPMHIAAAAPPHNIVLLVPPPSPLLPLRLVPPPPCMTLAPLGRLSVQPRPQPDRVVHLVLDLPDLLLHLLLVMPLRVLQGRLEGDEHLLEVPNRVDLLARLAVEHVGNNLVNLFPINSRLVAQRTVD